MGITSMAVATYNDPESRETPDVTKDMLQETIPHPVERAAVVTVVGLTLVLFSFFRYYWLGPAIRILAGFAGLYVLLSAHIRNVRGLSGVEWVLCWLLYLVVLAIALGLVIIVTSSVL